VLAAATYPGLRGTVTLTETNSSGTLQLTGVFGSYLGAGLHTTDLELRQHGASPNLWSIRAVGTGLYCRFGAKAWQDFTAAGPTAGTADGTSVRHVAGQLLAGLDQQAYIDLLPTAHNLSRSPAPAGTYAFTASTAIEDGGSTAAQVTALR
jgi:hypothetical protein